MAMDGYSDDDGAAGISEFVNLLRLGFAKDEEVDSAHAMWQKVYGAIAPSSIRLELQPDGSARSPDLEAHVRRLTVLIGGAAFLSVQLAKFVAELKNLPLEVVIDKTEAFLLRDDSAE